jgi:hypothetical protein
VDGQILLIVHPVVTNSDELLEVFHQILVSGVVPGLQAAVDGPSGEEALKPLLRPTSARHVLEDMRTLVPNLKEIDAARALLRQQLMSTVRFTFLLSPERYKEVAERFPDLVQMCGVDVVREPSKKDLAGMCQEALAPMKLWPSLEPKAKADKADAGLQQDNLRGIKPPDRSNLNYLSAEIHHCALTVARECSLETFKTPMVPPSRHTEMLRVLPALLHKQRKSLWEQAAGLQVNIIIIRIRMPVQQIVLHI